MQLEGKGSGGVQKALNVGERVTNFTETLGRPFDFSSWHVGGTTVTDKNTQLQYIIYIILYYHLWKKPKRKYLLSHCWALNRAIIIGADKCFSEISITTNFLISLSLSIDYFQSQFLDIHWSTRLLVSASTTPPLHTQYFSQYLSLFHKSISSRKRGRTTTLPLSLSLQSFL